MERRTLGRTGLSVSILGYGAGAVGGLMVRGSASDQERAMARAIAAGINYIDTAPLYGDGESERTLGRILPGSGANIVLGTKVRIQAHQRGDVAGAIAASLEESLRRLKRDSVDLLQLHNPITAAGSGNSLTPEVVVQGVAPALARLREQGRIRFCGITAIGEPTALRRVIDSRLFDTAQVPHNLLNPSAAMPLPAGSAMPDQEGLMLHAKAAGMGVIGIRVLAGGALSGTEARDPIAMPKVEPIASGPSYAADVAAARRLLPLVERGIVGDLVEAAIRFAAMPEAMSTVLVGTASLGELDHAIASIEKGPLPPQALALI